MVKEAIRKSLLNLSSLAELMQPENDEQTHETRYTTLKRWSNGTRTPLAENCARLADALQLHRDSVNEAIADLRALASGRPAGGPPGK